MEYHVGLKEENKTNIDTILRDISVSTEEKISLQENIIKLEQQLRNDRERLVELTFRLHILEHRKTREEELRNNLANFLEHSREDREKIMDIEMEIRDISAKYYQGKICKIEFENATKTQKELLDETKEKLAVKQIEFRPQCIHCNFNNSYFIDHN